MNTDQLKENVKQSTFNQRDHFHMESLPDVNTHNITWTVECQSVIVVSGASSAWMGFGQALSILS